MAIRGRQRWTPVDALKQQFDDGRDYISCPECKAFLGDNKPFRPVRNFARQHMDGREHLTCPKCHALLGRVYWEAPTTGDKISHIFCGYMGWKGRMVAAMALGLAAMIVFIFAVACERKVSVIDYLMTYNLYIWGRLILTIPLPIFLLAFFFLTPATFIGHGGGWYPWWLTKK